MSFLANPVIALFLSMALGYFIGRLRVGPIQLGGICGTLLVALALGQFGVRVSSDLKETAFALFIYALGFSAGPQFFANIRGGWRYGIFSVIEVICALLLVAAAIVIFHLDIGTASGLFAGSATESAVVGTASEAISHLSLPQAAIEELQGNIATAYSLTYLFGLIGIVVFVTQIAPLILGIDLKQEAQALARKLGSPEDVGDQPEGLPLLVGRAFCAGSVAGQTVGDVERSRNWSIAIEGVHRGSDVVEALPELVVEPRDILFIRGRRNAVISVRDLFGDEVPVPDGASITLVSRDVVLSRKEVFGRQIRDLRRLASPELHRGVFVSNVRRLGQQIPALSGAVLQQGDVLTLYGPEKAVERAAIELGNPLPATHKTDFTYLGIGIVVGLLIGHLSLELGAMRLTLGSGGGALISGLVFGWLNMRNPSRGGFPLPAAEFAKDIGLAAFIAAIGLEAGPHAIKLIMQYGLILPILGLLVSVVPAAVSLYVGSRLVKVDPPILLGIIAGQHCSTPTISTLVSQAGSSIPVIGYTVTYAISNVLLPLMGPIIVGVAAALAP
ncbi:aspartate-alanine antiporter [Rhizobium sp. BK181]|uniref:aspartate-alanine antiporter n=1 Tax=Rhizobium sp. BK181 TaxID=2587072 RepID=UPI00160B1542|nr:aspartate-alanine antiporter [Rhizobium sp. BK181]MBB3316666.1 aspartate-alanine antiporter [Rhizobium sp. BK181]